MNSNRRVEPALGSNAPGVGFEPTTSELTVHDSTAELTRNNLIRLLNQNPLDSLMDHQENLLDLLLLS
jgi:hypothetical protein